MPCPHKLQGEDEVDSVSCTCCRIFGNQVNKCPSHEVSGVSAGFATPFHNDPAACATVGAKVENWGRGKELGTADDLSNYLRLRVSEGQSATGSSSGWQTFSQDALHAKNEETRFQPLSHLLKLF